ncbi:MAG: hypothetical protein IPH69_10990 [Bacteroidales bacterium]|nr:hypothetical protein [Bacteroidales bacterium]MBK7626594.1 hypothetical protein [Bacteroidales bacterium]
MSDISYFESRKGNLTCSAQECFNFTTDLRHFEGLIPNNTINNWKAEKESCSFTVSMLGTVSVRLTDKEMYKRVVYKGDALKKNDFELVLNISGDGAQPAEVKVILNAELNPMMKMIAAKPIEQFLEMLINEMEKFKGWK